MDTMIMLLTWFGMGFFGGLGLWLSKWFLGRCGLAT